MIKIQTPVVDTFPLIDFTIAFSGVIQDGHLKKKKIMLKNERNLVIQKYVFKQGLRKEHGSETSRPSWKS